jgi:hypothetical protein
MDLVREKTSASNEPICKEEKAEFQIALIAISLFPLGFSFDLVNKTKHILTIDKKIRTC